MGGLLQQTATHALMNVGNESHVSPPARSAKAMGCSDASGIDFFHDHWLVFCRELTVQRCTWCWDLLLLQSPLKECSLDFALVTDGVFPYLSNSRRDDLIYIHCRSIPTLIH